MKDPLPKTDSIAELAAFWDSHDVTQYEGELVEVASPFARRGEAVAVPLSKAEHDAVRRIASSRGLPEGDLLHEWVKEKLHQP